MIQETRPPNWHPNISSTVKDYVRSKLVVDESYPPIVCAFIHPSSSYASDTMMSGSDLDMLNIIYRRSAFTSRLAHAETDFQEGLEKIGLNMSDNELSWVALEELAAISEKIKSSRALADLLNASNYVENQREIFELNVVSEEELNLLIDHAARYSKAHKIHGAMPEEIHYAYKGIMEWVDSAYEGEKTLHDPRKTEARKGLFALWDSGSLGTADKDFIFYLHNTCHGKKDPVVDLDHHNVPDAVEALNDKGLIIRLGEYYSIGNEEQLKSGIWINWRATIIKGGIYRDVFVI
ncbi:MAG: hypothetical protein QF632_02880 [Candidatus Woesearchaeota archaeon]|jgi:hypothetical protein|nr:hypothetical protein [Candidatus Woesearchaeota archaeon]MDP7323681.1 hypothetical protein [Candidatus Woesearchaeota archaeon]|tara:strand:+ start:95 stop:973 length:879 start_codon:yes stop_codon:yes gene_type:complete